MSLWWDTVLFKDMIVLHQDEELSLRSLVKRVDEIMGLCERVIILLQELSCKRMELLSSFARRGTRD